MDTFTATTDAVGGNLALSAAVATIPLLTFFSMLLVLKAKAWQAGLAGLAAAILVAVFGFGMPGDLALLSATEGAAFGFFPIVWIVVMALWFYQLTVLSGRFEDLRTLFDTIGGGDIRIQAVLIAFCFGGMLEALAGFGAPVAIAATMLLALGIAPLTAAIVVLLANVAPVAFGAIGTPITTAGQLTGVPATDIGAIIGLQAPLISFSIPFLLVLVIDGVKGLRDTWPALAVIGGVYTLALWWSSTYFSYELTGVVAALMGMAAAVGFLRFWKPKGAHEAATRLGITQAPADSSLTPTRIWMAIMPYLLVVVVFGIAKLWKLGINVPEILSSTDISIPWPGLHGHILNDGGEAITSTVYRLPWLSSPGTLMLITGLLVAAIYSVYNGGGKFPITVGNAVAEIGRSFYTMRFSGLTIMCVLAVAYVMNFSGQTLAMGTLIASVGSAFAFFSPILGWVGTAVTGSDTSANALFSNLQQNVAHEVGIDPALMLASNTTGGGVGKMISPQSLAIAATAVRMEGQESKIFRKALPWSIGLLIVVCTIAFLQSNLLAWMLP